MSNAGNGNIIRRIDKKTDFTQIDNNIFKNKKISLKAKGLISMMLSFSDNWEFSVNGLVALSKDGKDSVRSGLNELEEAGYLLREYPREEGKFTKTIFNISEFPILGGKTVYGKTDTDKPTRETRHNKELSNKEISNKEISNIKTIVEQPKERYDYSSVIDYLNEVTGSNYRNASSHQTHIRARYKEGYTLEDFKQVIDIKSAEWKNDKEYSKYLRPSTLFGNKFDTYLNQVSKHKEELNRAKPILEFT